MNKAVIISGEASETESEDEDTQHKMESAATGRPLQNIGGPSIKGAVISGEDSESETEPEGSVSSAISALGCKVSPSKKGDKYDSLLHQKLRESNNKLHNDVENYIQGVVSEAEKTLVGIDQQLIRSQLTLQSAVTSLKALKENSLAIKSRLQCLISAQFIPNISTSK